MDIQKAIQSFSDCASFLCNHCEAGCETPSCRTVIEAQNAIAFLKGAKNTEQANQPDSQYDLGGLILPGSMWAEQ